MILEEEGWIDYWTFRKEGRFKTNQWKEKVTRLIVPIRETDVTHALILVTDIVLVVAIILHIVTITTIALAVAVAVTPEATGNGRCSSCLGL